MSNHTETTEEAIAALYRYADFVQKYSGEITVGHDALREYAARIEAAVKRERAIADVMLAVKDKPLPHPDPDNAPPLFAVPGSAAALREALEAIDRNTDLLDIAEDIAPNLHPSHSFVAVQIRKIARAALAAPPEPPSNAAALRAALEKVHKAFCDGLIGAHGIATDAEAEALFRLWHIEIPAALAAPACNCDVSRDTKETIERCLASLNVESSSASFDAGVCAAIGWLFAEAAERKGENK